MRSTNPSYYLQSLARLVRSPDFYSDLIALAGIDEGDFARAEQTLREFVGFLDSDAARKQLTGVVTEDIAGTIWNFARNLGALRSKLGCSADELAQYFLGEIGRLHAETEGAKVSEAVLVTLRARIGKLAEPIRGIEQQVKAVALTEATGNMLRDVAVVCDIRPVFDEERSKIEGLFPVAPLQLTFETPRRSRPYCHPSRLKPWPRSR
jgi:hypothetical protein